MTTSTTPILPLDLPPRRSAGLFAFFDEFSGDSIFLGALGMTTVLKLVLISVVPLTGDEAYYVMWGRHLDYGYYDHGAMTGWWMAAVLWLGDAAWLIRLPAVLTTMAIGVMIWRTLRPIDREKAGWVAAMYLWSPHSTINVFFTTDTPLLFFSAVSGVFAFRACRDNRPWDYLLSGTFLGMAFLSKYFAVLLGLSYAVLYLFCIGRPRVLGLLLTFLAVLPWAAINVAWNYHHGWTNIVFNLYTRQDDDGVSMFTSVLFLGTTLLLLGPLAWYLFRPRFPHRQTFAQAWRDWRATGLIAFAIAFAFPQVVLFMVSFTNRIGVHWPMSFYPFAFATLPGLFTFLGTRRMTYVMAFFGGTLVIGAIIIALMPVEMARNYSSYPSIIMGCYPREILSSLKQLGPGHIITTPSYSKSALLSLHYDTHVPVLGPGSFHARQDDFLTDLRQLDGRDILMITHKRAQAEEALPWFTHANIREFDLRGARFFVLDGQGFRYPLYHRLILRKVARNYYQVPPFLARWSPPPPFLVRYSLLPTPRGR